LAPPPPPGAAPPPGGAARGAGGGGGGGPTASARALGAIALQAYAPAARLCARHLEAALCRWQLT